MSQNKIVVDCLPEHVINEVITLSNLERKAARIICSVIVVGYILLGLMLYFFGYGNGPFGDETVLARVGMFVLYVSPFVVGAYYVIKLSVEEQRRYAVLSPLTKVGYLNASKFMDNEPTSLDDYDFSKWDWLGDGEAKRYAKYCAIKKLSGYRGNITLPRRIRSGV